MIYKHFNYHILLSYFGILPFIFIVLDINIFNIFDINFLKDFIIYYSLLIFTFVGAIRWNFNNTLSLGELLCGFLPSLLSTILILINLLKFNQSLILFFIFILLFSQLFSDFLFYKKNIKEFFYFTKIRLPLTLLINCNIFYLIFV